MIEGVWIRSIELPTRRFGAEWLCLFEDLKKVLVVRGAPAIAAVELLAQPRHVGELVERVDIAAGAEAATNLVSLLEEMRTGRMLISAAEAVPIHSHMSFGAEPISFFTSALDSLFGGMAAPSCKPGPGGGRGNCQC